MLCVLVISRGCSLVVGKCLSYIEHMPIQMIMVRCVMGRWEGAKSYINRFSYLNLLVDVASFKGSYLEMPYHLCKVSWGK